MFYEVNRGYVGLGSMTVYRTAAQTAKDIEQFGKDLGPLEKQGGLLTSQAVMKYSAAQGRVQALQKEVESTYAHINGLQNQLNNIVAELEDLGMMKAGDYVKMGAKLAASAKIPLIGWLSIGAQIGAMFGIDLSFLDPFDFGGAKKKKKKAERLMKQAQELLTQMTYWKKRADALQSEGETLAKTIKDEGEKGINVKLIAIPQHVETKQVFTDVFGPDRVVTGIIHQTVKTIKNTPESQVYGRTLFKTSEELSKRVNLQPSGDRLPVGFQTIYSPVLEHGKIVAKVPQINAALPNPTDRRIVYGGLLSGVGQERDVAITGMAILGIVVGYYFLMSARR